MNFSEQEIKVYSNEHGYFTRLSRRNIKDEWENGFFYIKFKKGVTIENKSKIKLKDSWLTFYKVKDKETNVERTVWYVYVNEFEVLVIFPISSAHLLAVL